MIYLSIGRLDFPECLRLLSTVEAVEIRLDLNNYSIEEIKKLFAANKNIIATCRPGVFSDQERLEFLQTAINSGAALVDIELEAPQNYQQELMALAKQHNRQIIISYHNFTITPSTDELELIMARCFSAGADIAKIVCYAATEEDAERVMSLYASTQPISAFAMGPAWRNSRIIAALCGAEISYAALSADTVTAEGQFSYAELSQIVTRMRDGEVV